MITRRENALYAGKRGRVYEAASETADMLYPYVARAGAYTDIGLVVGPGNPYGNEINVTDENGQLIVGFHANWNVSKSEARLFTELTARYLISALTDRIGIQLGEPGPSVSWSCEAGSGYDG